MTPIRTILLCCVVIFLASCSERGQMPGKGFEGKLVQRITVNPAGLVSHKAGDSSKSASPASGLSMLNLSVTLTMYSKGNKVAYDLEALGFPIKVHSIIDRNARTITMVTPDKMAYVTDLRSMDSTRAKVDDSIRSHSSYLDTLAAHLPQPTGVKKTINGLACEEFKSSFGATQMDLWVTHDPRLKFYDIMRDAFLGKAKTGLGGIEEALSIIAPFMGEGNVPVSLEISTGGVVGVKSELTEISEESVSDDLVNIPSGYQVVKH